jgi:predicted ATP-grasp superfamily ATP-dependent carboligase
MSAARPRAVVFPDNPAALAVCRELGSAGIPVTVLHDDRRGPAAWSRFATFVQSPDLYRDAAGYVEFLNAHAEEWGPGAVLFPTEDAALLVLERHKADLSGGFRLSYAADAALGLVDKRRLQATAAAAGLATPRTDAVRGSEDAARFARSGWLVKPPCRYRLDANGQVRSLRAVLGGRKAIGDDLVHGIEAIAREGFPVLVQETIDGPLEDLCSIGLCVGPGGEVLASFSARKRLEYPEPFGDGLIVESIADPGLEEQAVRLLRAAGYWGLCDVEFKRDRRDGRFKLLDANPRAWLWIGLGALSGAPLVRAAYALAVGEAWRPCRGVAGAGWLSPRGALGFLRHHYRPRRHGLGLPLSLGWRLARQGMQTWRTFRDPLYVRGAAVRSLLHRRVPREHGRRADHLPPIARVCPGSVNGQ